MGPESFIFRVLRSTAVVNRESFTLATFDPETGERNGSISAQDFAAELIHVLGLCEHAEIRCQECEQTE
jgi:hypothetical protein